MKSIYLGLLQQSPVAPRTHTSPWSCTMIACTAGMSSTDSIRTARVNAKSFFIIFNSLSMMCLWWFSVVVRRESPCGLYAIMVLVGQRAQGAPGRIPEGGYAVGSVKDTPWIHPLRVSVSSCSLRACRNPPIRIRHVCSPYSRLQAARRKRPFVCHKPFTSFPFSKRTEWSH